MAGFTSYDQIVNALTVSGYGRRNTFQQTLPSTTVANIPHSMWAATGIPTAGGNTSAGKANGRVLTKATAGAHPFSNAPASRTQHLTGMGAFTLTSTTGTLLLADRIADCNIAANEATGSFTGTGLVATSRLAATTSPGDGCQIWLEVTTALGAGATSFTFTYTNQLGTGSKTTPSISLVASAIVGRSATAGLWVPLASGDTGVRSIESLTLTGGTTGNLNVCLVRPLLYLPLPSAGIISDRDCVMEMPGLDRLYDDSCLFLIVTTTSAATASVAGEVRTCSN